MQTLIAPRRLFRTFGPYAPWLGALAISTLIAVIATAGIPDSVFVEQVRDPTDRLGRPVTVTSDPATIGRWGRIMAAFSAVIFQPMLALGLAGVLALIFGTPPRRAVSYVQYLAVTTHALLIPALGSLLLLAIEFRQFAGTGATMARVGFAAWALVVAVIGARALPPLEGPETFAGPPP